MNVASWSSFSIIHIPSQKVDIFSYYLTYFKVKSWDILGVEKHGSVTLEVHFLIIHSFHNVALLFHWEHSHYCSTKWETSNSDFILAIITHSMISREGPAVHTLLKVLSLINISFILVHKNLINIGLTCRKCRQEDEVRF